ncbi:hypothetical protein X943_003145 [Babesia divergens]|uniref:Pru domain-containing protein n=1 Tax=Babesia divergens TaxID=32595 RepID=A0AAD9G7N3_BABDI|nr:hypothetical protein X943_003145 [Babesia divergens]
MASDTGVLCEVRAGKCRFEGDMVHPCLKKGTLRLYQVREKSHMDTTSQGVDELLCLQWHARDEKEMEDCYYVFGDAYLERVNQCKDGEVYALKFTGNAHRVLYWMQEPDVSVIRHFVEKVNSTIGYKPRPTDEEVVMESSI